MCFCVRMVVFIFIFFMSCKNDSLLDHIYIERESLIFKDNHVFYVSLPKLMFSMFLCCCFFMRECIWKHKSDSKDTNHSQHLDVSINNNKRVNKMKKKEKTTKRPLEQCLCLSSKTKTNYQTNLHGVGPQICGFKSPKH